MNKIYKVIWSKTRNCYVAVSEIAKRNGKNCTSVHRGGVVSRGLAARVLCTLLLGTYLVGGYSEPVAWGAPTGDGAIIQGDYPSASGTIASAWGDSTLAAGSYATAWGDGAKAYGDYSTAFGSGTAGNEDNASAGYYATAFGTGTTATGLAATVWGYQSLAGAGTITVDLGLGDEEVEYNGNGDYATAWGDQSRAIGDYSTAFGQFAKAIGVASVAFGGEGSTAIGDYSAAFGQFTIAKGIASVSSGYYSKAIGDYSVAFGNSSVAEGENSLAGLGGHTYDTATNSVALGSGAGAYTANSVALGSGSSANRTSGLVSGWEAYLGEEKTGSAWISTQSAIAVGTIDPNDDTLSITRQITGVAAGSEDTDAVNVAQLKAAMEGAGGGATYDAGDGIAITGTGTKTISVKADTTNDFEFDSGTLKIKKGAVASGDTGLVTGGTVYTEVRPDSDGTYVKKTNTTKANLAALDTKVKENTDAIGDAGSGLVKKVNDNATAIAGKADASTVTSALALKANAADVYAKGEVYTQAETAANFAKVDASNLSAANITAWGTTLDTGAVASGNAGLVSGGKVFTAISTKANTDMDNLTTTGKAAVRGLVNVAQGSNVTVTKTTAGDVDTYTISALGGGGATYDAGDGIAITGTGTKTISVKADTTNDFEFDSGTLKIKKGAVASGDTGLVTGGTVYDALAGKADAADVYTKAEVNDRLDAKANAADVYTKAEVNDRLDAKANAADVYTKTEVNDRLDAKANAADVYTKTEVNDKLDAKANAADVYTKTEAEGKFAEKDNVYTKSEMNSKLDAKADQTALDAVKATVDAMGDLSALTSDVNDLKAKNGGEVAADSDKNVTGKKVYDYLNGDSVALGANSTKIAIGQGSSATGSNSIAIGFGNQVTGANSGAFGDPNTVTGTGSYAFGNNNNISGNDSFVLGTNATATGNGNVVLGEGSTDDGGTNVVSVGASGGERQIKHVAEGTDATDAATFGQVNSVAQSVNRVDSKINKVGAGAAALAALHPIDTDDKFSMGLGYGNYRDAHAGAIGLFYRPTEKIMMSVGGSLGNGENMINAGISFALDKGKGFGTSKAAMARKIAALTEENAAQAAKIESLEARLAAIEAKLAK